MAAPEPLRPTPEDLAELKRLSSMAITPYVGRLLRDEIAKVIMAIPPDQLPAAVPAPAAPAPTREVFQPIETYAFEEGKTTATVRLPGIDGLDTAKIEFTPTERAFEIAIRRVGLPNLKLIVSPLFKKVVPAKCTFKKGSSSVTIVLHKRKEKTWYKLKASGLSMRTKEEKQRAKEDPSGSLMDMMRKMYDEGDDEMKRRIGQAMYEAQRGKGEGDKDKKKKEKAGKKAKPWKGSDSDSD